MYIGGSIESGQLGYVYVGTGPRWQCWAGKRHEDEAVLGEGACRDGHAEWCIRTAMSQACVSVVCYVKILQSWRCWGGVYKAYVAA